MRSPLRVLLPSTLLLGCRGLDGDPGDDDDDDDDDSTPCVQPAPRGDLDDDRRLDFMREVFEPQMRARVRGFDPVLFDGFECESCHGTDLEAQDSDMPNGLEPLDGRGDPVHPSYDAERIGQFMEDEVIPLARELLDRPSGPDRVRCTDRHEQEQVPQAPGELPGVGAPPSDQPAASASSSAVTP